MIVQQLQPAGFNVAMELIRRLVDQAEQASIRLGRLPFGVDRKEELLKANTAVSEARGAVILMRILYPDDPTLHVAWRRVIHCPVVMLVGPEIAAEEADRQPAVM